MFKRKNEIRMKKPTTINTNDAINAQELLHVLSVRFEKNKHRHKGITWESFLSKLETLPAKQKNEKLQALLEMERTGGEPDIISYDTITDTYTFIDCSAESPIGRRSVCYDRDGLDARKEFKPQNTAMDMATEMGIELLDEIQYRALQTLEKVDTKTSSWLKTPADIRKLGGAIFGDYRYGNVFIYHNGAQSYYGSRGFRGWLRI